MAEQTAKQQVSSSKNGQEHAHGHDCGHGHEEGHSCSTVPVFDTRDLLIREDIMAKAKELAEMIYTSEEVQHYRRAEKQINGNERIQSLISQIKKKQKEIVAFQSFQNQKMVDKIEGEIEALQDELDAIPIVSDFQQSQSDINYLLQLVISVIRDTVAQRLDVESASAPETEDCSD
ncbi:RicAFT regulatory complex protein RicA family protein [Paenibacillus tarimensis]|uniref:RicAFT regulatory complex protein RicA family protein n=1 Tax=Paenibacillus tarimensis TaxID=416012 RepID=UPI001F22666A|nr:YlbF family regulator [Paenibacillus tarimensis]MCF2942391.1 YlbF family regulator [Paenibacillus tarimensis]